MMILNFGCCKSTVVVLLLVGLLVPANAMAQVDMGSISGIVRDPSGAAIPNAKVVLTNQDTNITVSTMTGSEGQYTFSPVKSGATPCQHRRLDSRPSSKTTLPSTCSRRSSWTSRWSSDKQQKRSWSMRLRL